MRRLIVILTLALLTMLLLTVTALAEQPLRGQMVLDFYPDNPIWRGTITGDITGDMFFTNTGPGKRGDGDKGGNIISFEETWKITATGDENDILLEGTDAGVASLANNKYRMNGAVTGASSDWSHLIGRQVHISGDLTWDQGVPPTPLTAPGIFQVN